MKRAQNISNMNYHIQHWLEKESDPFKFIEHFRCSTEPIGGGTEYDEEGELVDYEAAITAIEMALDKKMLDRACEWLKNRHNIEKCLGVLTSRTEDLAKVFRQAMEGGAE